MKVVLMAGGRGTRISELFPDVPKPLIPIQNMPVLEREIISLREQGFTEIILTVGYMADKIKDYFGDGSRLGVKINYFVEDKPLGNAGALFFLDLKEDFLLLNADAVFDVDFNRMVKDVFLPYKNGKLMDSRNSETFLPEYSNTLNRRNPVLNAVFNTEELKDKLEEYVNQSYTKFVNYIEKYNMLSMQYCLEMDLVATDKASELYYDHYNLLGEKRNRKSLLIERKDAIKDPTVLLEIFDRLNPSEYPFSFKKIKNILVKKIKTAIITQRQNMEVEE